jgi:hypothetical protein
MPEMQNLDTSTIFIDAIVDVERRVQNPSDLRMFLQSSAQVREGFEQRHMVKKFIRELFGGFGMLLSRPLKYGFQIG